MNIYILFTPEFDIYNQQNLGVELPKSVGMACACVFVIAFLLLADTWTTLMVCGCVAMTLIDVIGALNFWDVTLDPFSSVDICLSVGLCIDYPVHIAHSFLVSTGNKNSIKFPKLFLYQ